MKNLRQPLSNSNPMLQIETELFVVFPYKMLQLKLDVMHWWYTDLILEILESEEERTLRKRPTWSTE